MKIAIYNDYGGWWGLPTQMIEELGYDPRTEDRYRNDPKLVKLIMKDIVNNKKSVYGIVEIPDEVTDWEISEYDGWESVTYVLDGKIHHKNADLFRDFGYDGRNRVIDNLNILKEYKEDK